MKKNAVWARRPQKGAVISKADQQVDYIASIEINVELLAESGKKPLRFAAAFYTTPETIPSGNSIVQFLWLAECKNVPGTDEHLKKDRSYEATAVAILLKKSPISLVSILLWASLFMISNV